MENCDGRWASVVSETSCTVPLLILQAAPYNWVRGDSIFAKISASNVWGESALSNSGNGAIVVTIPSPPINLLNNASVTTDTKIGFSWSDGIQTGGKPITEYRVSWDRASGSWVTLESGLTTKSYATKVTLIAGEYYSFKVESRNSVGYSLVSASVTILAAVPPYQPVAPTVTQADSIVTVSWLVRSYDGGTAITSYQVTFRASDGVTFYPSATYCNGTTDDIRKARSCTIPSIVFTGLPWNLPWGSFIYAQVSATNI